MQITEHNYVLYKQLAIFRVSINWVLIEIIFKPQIEYYNNNQCSKF